jgi:molecular chaperone GrpE
MSTADEIPENAPSPEVLPPVAAAEVPEAAVADLRPLLEDARAKADENFDKFMRVTAELENTRRRVERDLEAARKFALERFVTELLPVRDSLELGIDAAGEPQTDVAKLHEGMQLTLRMLGDAMQKFGVERIDPQGAPFDPNLHQALSVQPRDDVPPNTVVVVVQKGYALNGRLVRPAMVMVSRPSEARGIDEKA